MNIVVFGATGRTGRNIVDQALNEGHEVTAFIHESRTLQQSIRLRLIEGDVLDINQVAEAVRGQDAVLSALGRGSSPKPVTFPGTRNMIDAMKKLGVRRLIIESAYGAGDSAKQISSLNRLLVRGLLLRSTYKDKDLMEECVQASELDWTLVRPARLTDGPKSGDYRVGERIPLSIASGISRADVADFMLKQVDAKDFIRKKPSIGP